MINDNSIVYHWTIEYTKLCDPTLFHFMFIISEVFLFYFTTMEAEQWEEFKHYIEFLAGLENVLFWTYFIDCPKE